MLITNVFCKQMMASADKINRLTKLEYDMIWVANHHSFLNSRLFPDVFWFSIFSDSENYYILYFDTWKLCVTLKGKNLLPMWANSCLLEKLPIRRGDKHCCAWIIFPEIISFLSEQNKQIFRSLFMLLILKYPYFFPICEVLSNFSWPVTKFHSLIFSWLGKKYSFQGPVVQSIVSLTSSLEGQLVKCLTTL